MNLQSAINKEIFIPRDERLLVAVEVQRRRRKRMSFLPTGAKAEYKTFICLSVTNKRPHQLHITKVKQFEGSSSFTSRSQWTVEQLRQVNGINPNKDSPEFDLIFDNTEDQWVASSSPEKCIFVQILYHACQTYWEGKAGSLGKTVKLGKASRKGKPGQSSQQGVGAGPSVSQPGPSSRTLQARRKSYVPPKQTEFINCQSKLTGDACTMNLVIYRCKAFLNRMKTMMVSNPSRTASGGAAGSGSAMANVVQRMNVALGERGDRLSRAEDKTVDLMQRAQQFADTAHKLALKYSK
ncbi:syntaxin binding protein 6 (amisyn), like [Notolabrus celidotus]|uniref:syntaxin binding protein 6 (amisyn), like n=1 Tax=Notolabrus celidotus TaxID=1203425 RepID=UPI00148FAA28|nr:syntaxin binding protein 6 (amisyn), like [Notolabrus celidotus]XP_034555438.1 syntaxin binding protein 6 (amisyn), like [Notolabrus celidotus]